jgi:hypothetical protein
MQLSLWHMKFTAMVAFLLIPDDTGKRSSITIFPKSCKSLVIQVRLHSEEIKKIHRQYKHESLFRFDGNFTGLSV